MTKVEELRTESPKCPRGTARHPAGLKSALQHDQLPLLPCLWLIWTPLASSLDMGRGPGSPAVLTGPFVGNMWWNSLAERTVYLDLCLIFLLLRFSLWSDHNKSQLEENAQWRGLDSTAWLKNVCWKQSYLRMRFFRHCKKERQSYIIFLFIHAYVATHKNTQLNWNNRHMLKSFKFYSWTLINVLREPAAQLKPVS